MTSVTAPRSEERQGLNSHPFNPSHLAHDAAPRTEAGPAKQLNLPAISAFMAGGTFTLASAATNLTYAVAKSDALATQITWGAVAVATSVGLALAPAAVVTCLSQRKYGPSSLALAATVLFGAYSVTAALGSATGGRLVAELEAGDIAGKRRTATADIVKAEGDLTALGAARAAATIDAEINAVFSRTPGLSDCAPKPNWTPSRAHREACKTISLLQIERTKADERDKVQSRITAARKELAATSGRGTIANSDAVALQGFAAAIGVNVGTDVINKLLVVLSVLLLELGGGLCFAVGQGLSGLGNSGTAAQRPRVREGKSCATNTTSAPVVVDRPIQVSSPSTNKVPNAPNVLRLPLDTRPKVSSPVPASGAQTPVNTVDAASNGSVQSLDVPADAGGRLLQLLSDRGGEVFGGHRSFARALGISHGHVSNVLDDLARAGRIVVEAGSKGTRVRLA